MDDLSPESIARCESALAYIKDMSEWYDEELEDAPKRDFVHRILTQIERRGDLSLAEAAWVRARIEERY